MIGLLQRVTQAQVSVAGEVVGAIGAGLLVFVCAERGDTERQAGSLLARLLSLRVFGDARGRMNLSLRDVGGGLLLVPQFTLAADTRSGARPSFDRAAPPEDARRLFDALVDAARREHPQVASGAFGARMQVALVNDGPVTIPLRVLPAG